MMVEFGVNDEYFMDWVDSVKYAFESMLETMIRVAEEVKKETQLITPIDTGKLSRSFKWTVVSDNSRFKVLQVQMSALNERTGYDYAMTQHRGYHTSKNGQLVWYQRDKFTEVGFFNYRRKYFGEGYEKETNWDAHQLHKGRDEYLYWGLKYSEGSAFEMIEKDYLSMFDGSFII